jgi:hypothetical protein
MCEVQAYATPTFSMCTGAVMRTRRVILFVFTTGVLMTVLVTQQVVFGEGVAKPGGQSRDEAKQEILTLEDEWYNAIGRLRISVVDRLEADDFVLIRSGIDHLVTKGQQLAGLKRLGPLALADKITRSFAEPRIRFYGDTALVNAIETVTRVEGDTRATYVSRSVYTGVWLKKDGHWQLVNAQWTDLPSKK